MIRRTYIDPRGEELRVDELHDHEMYDQGALHDLIHAVAIESVTITYKDNMSRNGVDGILHIQYEGFYPPEHDMDEEHEIGCSRDHHPDAVCNPEMDDEEE